MEQNLQNFESNQTLEIIDELFLYIGTVIGNFTSSQEFINNTKTKKNEKQFTSAISLYLTNKSESKYCFIPENQQKGNHSVDIGVYKSANLVLTIEAKILPTPKGKNRAVSEYVFSLSGSGAGIQRFKNNQHGLNNDDELFSLNAMLGYIRKKDFTHWLEQINSWIIEAGWSENEKLEKVSFSETAILKSKHTRINGSPLTLHHFWVDICN